MFLYGLRLLSHVLLCYHLLTACIMPALQYVNTFLVCSCLYEVADIWLTPKTCTYYS